MVETLPYDIVVDGWLVPDQPLKMIARGQQTDIPVMAGSTDRELSIYVAGYPDRSAQAFREWAKRRYAPVADDVLLIFPAPSSGDASESFIRAGTELIIAAPVRWLAEATSKKTRKTYLYRVNWAFGTQGGRELGAFHGIDVALLLRIPGTPWDESAEVMARVMRQYWVQFARTGDPNGPGLTTWPAYDSATASYLELGTPTRPAADLQNDAFRLIQRLYAARLARLAR